jgi:UDP:flavonoid glycosyltransferase YjiC (YdhE family)
VVIVPMGADQLHNGRLVAAAGAGLTLDNPDADALRAAVQTALDGSGLRLQARRLAEEIAAMPTIDDVVDAIVGRA